MSLYQIGQDISLSRLRRLLRSVRITRKSGLRLFTNVLWVIFILGASSVFRAILPGNVEKFFWLPLDLVAVAWIVMHQRQAIAMMAQNKILLSWAAIACLSTLWSLTPAISLYHGVQLFMTILAGFLLSAYAPRLTIMKLLFAALVIIQFLCVAFVVLKPGAAISVAGEWEGAFHHKNELGAFMALQILTALCLFCQGWRPLLTGAALLAALALLAMSRSSTALLALIVAMLAVPAAILYDRNSRLLVAGLGAAGIAGAAVIFASLAFGFDPFDLILGSVGKDSTLTGRTILWNFGMEAFWQSPLIGHGYKGYWESPATTAFQLHFVTRTQVWFFHNCFIETAVAFGIIGPVLLAVGLLIAFFRTVKDFDRERSYASLWPILFILYITVYVTAENPLFQNHGLFQFLFAVICTAREWRIDGRRTPSLH